MNVQMGKFQNPNLKTQVKEKSKMKRKTLPSLLPSLSLAMALVGLLIGLPGTVDAQVPDSIIITLQTPPYQVTTGSDGFDLVQIEGFDRFGAPGDPELPAEIYNIAVPPVVIWESLTVEILSAETIELPGTYEIAPAPPFATWIDGQQIVDWGENAVSIVDGKNTKVYQNDAYFPVSYVTSVTKSQMRKWRFARLLFTPVQYNPITKKLRLATAVELRVAFERRPAVQAQVQAELNDTIMDDKAKQILYNYDQAKGWYQPDSPPMITNAGTDYVIITTNAIVAGSSKLSDFVAHKEAKGYSVEVVTEDDYGRLTGQSPNGTAEKIRQWLIYHYLTKHIEYVLLIGNPDPDDPSSGSDSVGDVPMKMCWPRYTASSSREAPTDYFYADLTGNWDLDGDTYFGEYSDDRGSGGVDFTIEVYVGRIPVYANISGWETTLDNILQKIMDYENASDQAWRKTALLPMSFSDASTDGAYLAEHMKSDYLNGHGYTSYTLYQQGPSCSDSIFDSDETLLGGAVRNHWQNNSYGIVTWWAHGGSTSASIGYSGCWGGTLLSSNDTSSLDDSYPAFVYQCSCSNGYPEHSNNLGYALLRQGAIGTVSASRVSWYRVGTWSPSQSYPDNASIGYYFMQQIANEERAGKALYDVKSIMGSWGGGWMNLMDFNLYGDPSTRILGNGSVCNDPHEPNDTRGQATPLAYGTTLTDAEICLQADVDYYAFTGNAGDQVVADIDAQVIGSALDSYLSLYDSNGIELANNDDHDGLDSHIEYTLPADGTYYLLVQASGYPNEGGPDHFYTVRILTVASFPSCDGFEAGNLGTDWKTYTTDEGRVQVSSSYPYSGTYSVLLDDSIAGSTYSHAALILAMDLSGQSDVGLDFWWRDFDDEDHPADGVFLSDDWGTTWVFATNFVGSRSSFTNEIVDVDAIAAANGLTLNDHFQIKFQFYGEGSIPSDGYAIDQVCVRTPPKIEVIPTSFEETVHEGEMVTKTLTISNTGHAVLKFALAESDGGFAPAQLQARAQLHVGGRAHIINESKEAIPDTAGPDPLPIASGDPDSFGYTYKDSNEVDGPTYQWIEIAPPAGGSGTEIPSLTGVDDGYFWPLSLPFPFNFYGTDYTKLAVASNGTLYFEGDYLGLGNTPIPGSNYGVDTFIAHLWDDLVVDPGAVYYQALGPMLVIEYYQVGGYNTSGSGVWEIILFANGNILFQYQDATIGGFRDYGGSATVGIQGDTVTGLQYSYNTPALSDGLAICFAYPGQAPNCSPDVPWLSEAPTTGTVPADSAQAIDIIFDASMPEVTQLGEYYATLFIQSNDPGTPLFQVPVTMTVAHIPSYNLFLPLIMR
jgi:hypothetical protein